MLPLLPSMPLWLAHERETRLQIDAGLLSCIGFIGAPEGAAFVADGTCFCVGYPEETEMFHYLVTARHLVRPTKFGREELPEDGEVKIRLSRKDKPPRIVATRRGDWITPSDRFIDLAIFPWDYRRLDPDNELEMGAMTVAGPDPLLLTPHWLAFWGKPSIGDEIFIPSLFPGHTGERMNIPIVRVGNIAATPLEPVRVGSPTTPAYLIETKSLGGISGAPVFIHLRPERPRSMPTSEKRRDGLPGYSVPYALIGIVLGIHSGQYVADFVHTDDNETVIGRDADFNAGISVVLPVEILLALLESPEMVMARKTSLAAIQRQSGYRPASATRSFPPIDAKVDVPDENPEHREDFRRLISAAAKKRPRAD